MVVAVASSRDRPFALPAAVHDVRPRRLAQRQAAAPSTLDEKQQLLLGPLCTPSRCLFGYSHCLRAVLAAGSLRLREETRKKTLSYHDSIGNSPRFANYVTKIDARCSECD